MVTTRSKWAPRLALSGHTRHYRTRQARTPSPLKTPTKQANRKPLTKYHTPQKATVLGALKHQSHLLFDKEIYEAYEVPKRTARRWKKKDQEAATEQARRDRNTLSRRGRKTKIDANTIEKMKRNLEGDYHARISS